MSNTLFRAISHVKVEGPCPTIEKPSGIIPVSVGQGGIEVDGNVVKGVSELPCRRDGAVVKIGEPRCQLRQFRGLSCQSQLRSFRLGRGVLRTCASMSRNSTRRK